MKASTDDFLGHPHRAGSAQHHSGKKKQRGIKKCKWRRDETLPIRAHTIRRNAEWQKHVLFSHLNWERKAPFFGKLRRADSRQRPRVFTGVSEWRMLLLMCTSPSAAQPGKTSVTHLWVMTCSGYSWCWARHSEHIVTLSSPPSYLINVSFTCKTLSKCYFKYYSFIKWQNFKGTDMYHTHVESVKVRRWSVPLDCCWCKYAITDLEIIYHPAVKVKSAAITASGSVIKV